MPPCLPPAPHEHVLCTGGGESSDAYQQCKQARCLAAGLRHQLEEQESEHVRASPGDTVACSTITSATASSSPMLLVLWRTGHPGAGSTRRFGDFSRPRIHTLACPQCTALRLGAHSSRRRFAPSAAADRLTCRIAVIRPRRSTPAISDTYTVAAPNSPPSASPCREQGRLAARVTHACTACSGSTAASPKRCAACSDAARQQHSSGPKQAVPGCI